jgi:hypothetical protein
LKECPEGRPISLRFFKNRFFRVHDLRPARFMTGCGKGFIYQNRMTAGKKQGATGITTSTPSVCDGPPKSTVIQESDIASTLYKR